LTNVGRRGAARWLGALGGVLASATISACELNKTVIPRQEPQLSVHAILNTAERVQTFLVERVLGGEGGSGQAVAVTGAVVTLTIPGGRVITAREVLDTISSSPEDGLVTTTRYAISLDAERFSLVAGGAYDLQVMTPEGEVVRGSTRIPAQPSVTSSPTRAFNRDTDTLDLFWPFATGAAAYWLRVDGRGLSYEQLLDKTRIRLAGRLRSIDFDESEPLFTPGFVSTVTVAAVDTNAYDYFRSGNDPFTGLGLINHLTGAVGVFGSMSIVLSLRADVTATFRHPIEGRFTILGSQIIPARRAQDLRIFADSLPDASGTLALFGSYQRSTSGTREEIRGTIEGSQVTLYLFEGNLPGPPYSLRATLAGDTLTATYDQDGMRATFVRR
jgi:hypothetical protein